MKKMTESKPLVSIVTVVYNGVDYLEETIKSVITQKYENIEYIIIDGNSNDGTLDIIKKYEEQVDYWISEKDEGIYDAMNKGIKIANGKFINFLNAGDNFYNNDVLKSVFQYENIKRYDLIYGSAIVVNTKNKKEVILKPKAFTKFNLLLWTTRVVCHQSMFVNKSIIVPYTNKFSLKGELFWYFDLLKECENYLIVDIPIVYYSLGGTGDVNYKLNHKETIKVAFLQTGLLGILSLPITIYKYIRKVFND